MATAQIMSPARKIVTIAPTPGALMLIAVSPAVSRAPDGLRKAFDQIFLFAQMRIMMHLSMITSSGDFLI